MAEAQTGERTFNVVHHRPGGPAVAAGVIAIGADHRIRIVEADPKAADLLELAAETLNDKDTFMVRAAPPPDAEPMTLHKRAVARSEAAAGEAVIELLRRNYGFELTPAG
jgi:hypothetical protein